VVIFRGKGLEGPLTDADPHREGLPVPKVAPVKRQVREGEESRQAGAEFYKAALPAIAGKKPANGFLMRGIAHQPEIPLFQDRYGLRPGCIAVYPMYRAWRSWWA